MLITFILSITALYGVGDALPRVGLRLTGGNGPHEGNVEILFNHTTWKYICDDGWDARDAKVVCRQLEYTRALNATKYSHFPVDVSREGLDYNSTYFASRITCVGDEKVIRHCERGDVRLRMCDGTSNVAGVVCTNITDRTQTVPKPSAASGNLKNGLQFRIVGDERHGFISSGYLEVFYDGVWGSVCAESWTDIESYVACGNLGYPDFDRDATPAKEKSMYAPTHYWMNNVRCSGVESTLYECDHSGWKRHVCKVDASVYLNCKRSPFLRDNRFDRALISNHNLRLRSGYRHSEGRAEILYNGEWGSICDDNWSIRDASVFCREVGFGTAFAATHQASFGQGSGKVWLDEVQCSGHEFSLQNCKHSGWNKTDCGHKEDAGVKCHYPYGKPEAKIRLTGSSNPLRGIVEVMHEGKWKGICGIGWGLRQTGVVCRQLGLGFPEKALSTTRYGMVREFAMYSVECSGDELSITHCHHLGPDKGGCRYYDIAAVHCTPNAPDLVMDVEELRRSVYIDSRKLMTLSCASEEKCLAPDAKMQWWWPELFNRTLLRFSARFWNRGNAEFRPNVRKPYWQWHQCHQHFHSMERFADYDITDSHGIKRAEGHKASFCLEDYECEKGVSKKFRCENKGDQGLKVNCADTYRSHLDCQWIDITRLRYGYYKLRVVLNPQNLVYETDYSNNIASCEINYKRRGVVTVKSCQIDPCEKMSWGGVGDGACCKFPFVYKGKQYHSCTTVGHHGYLWCATTSNYDKDGVWGRC